MVESDKWEKLDDGDRVWWLVTDSKGDHIFSFDKVKRFNLFVDYPHKLTEEQKEIFDREYPFWAEYFGGHHEG